MRSYLYYTCDVFTDTRFGGNQLAVLPDATGLTSAEMQLIAREFNFAESTFVLPAEQGGTCRVRIFSKQKEYPFAGHPNVGTACVLAEIGTFGRINDATQVVFEELAGPVAMTIRPTSSGHFWSELRAPEALFTGPTYSAERMANMLSLPPEAIETTVHLPQQASVGLPFVIAQLKDRDALARAAVDITALRALAAEGVRPNLHVYVRSADDFDIRCRMFAPLGGTPEDSATGSANCALAGLLAHYADVSDGELSWTIAQGVEMGRPSRLDARARKADGAVTDVYIAGTSVLISKGELYL